MAEHRLTYRSTLEASEKLLDDLGELLARYRVDGGLSQRVLLVVSEAFNNALLHGNKRDPKKTITVVLRVNQSEIVADIIDQGEGGVEKVRSRRTSGPLVESGRGVDLMERLATSTRFEELADGGMKVTVSFCRSGGREYAESPERHGGKDGY